MIFHILLSAYTQYISIFIITYVPYCMCLHCFRLTLLMFVLSALLQNIVLS